MSSKDFGSRAIDRIVRGGQEASFHFHQDHKDAHTIIEIFSSAGYESGSSGNAGMRSFTVPLTEEQDFVKALESAGVTALPDVTNDSLRTIRSKKPRSLG